MRELFPAAIGKVMPRWAGFYEQFGNDSLASLLGQQRNPGSDVLAAFHAADNQ
jgi:hypothetical protein